MGQLRRAEILLENPAFGQEPRPLAKRREKREFQLPLREETLAALRIQHREARLLRVQSQVGVQKHLHAFGPQVLPDSPVDLRLRVQVPVERDQVHGRGRELGSEQ